MQRQCRATDPTTGARRATRCIRSIVGGLSAKRYERLKSPCGADRERIRITVTGADALVLGAKGYAPIFGLHTHAVGELVIGLLVAIGIGLAARPRGTVRRHDGGDIRIQPRHASLAEHIEERYW